MRLVRLINVLAKLSSESRGLIRTSIVACRSVRRNLSCRVILNELKILFKVFQLTQ